MVNPDGGDGLVEYTGGDTFVNSNNYQRIVDGVSGEAGHYYLHEYVPSNDFSRELHAIDVKMTRLGLRVRGAALARRLEATEDGLYFVQNAIRCHPKRRTRARGSALNVATKTPL
jgi:hypothetical protein